MDTATVGCGRQHRNHEVYIADNAANRILRYSPNEPGLHRFGLACGDLVRRPTTSRHCVVTKRGGVQKLMDRDGPYGNDRPEPPHDRESPPDSPAGARCSALVGQIPLSLSRGPGSVVEQVGGHRRPFPRRPRLVDLGPELMDLGGVGVGVVRRLDEMGGQL
jgi:hypothetical protein